SDDTSPRAPLFSRNARDARRGHCPFRGLDFWATWCAAWQWGTPPSRNPPRRLRSTNTPTEEAKGPSWGHTRAMASSTSDPLVPRAAALVLDAFEDYDARFGDLTRRARRRFIRRDWRGAQADALARIELQDDFLPEALGRFEALVGERMRSRPFWAAVRGTYEALTEGRSNAAMARTLFNSMSRRFFLTEGVAQALEFHQPGDGAAGDPDCPGELHSLPDGADACERWQKALRARGFPHRDIDADARAIADAVASRLPLHGADVADTAARCPDDPHGPDIALLDTVFYRERRAYL